MTEQAQSVHIVDDDAAILEALEMLLEAEGFRVRCYHCAGDFLVGGMVGANHCLITDLRMPGMSGFELMAELRARRIWLPIVAMTAYADIILAAEALKMGAVDFIVKPVNDKTLLRSLRAALALWSHPPSPGSRIGPARALPRPAKAAAKHGLPGLVKGGESKTVAVATGWLCRGGRFTSRPQAGGLCGQAARWLLPADWTWA